MVKYIYEKSTDLVSLWYAKQGHSITWIFVAISTWLWKAFNVLWVSAGSSNAKGEFLLSTWDWGMGFKKARSYQEVVFDLIDCMSLWSASSIIFYKTEKYLRNVTVHWNKNIELLRTVFMLVSLWQYDFW